MVVFGQQPVNKPRKAREKAHEKNRAETPARISLRWNNALIGNWFQPA